jgi:hypothetical protein
MDDAKQYRAYAEAALRMAAKSDDHEYKATMLKVAQGWLELAELAELPPRNRQKSSPLNGKKL